MPDETKPVAPTPHPKPETVTVAEQSSAGEQAKPEAVNPKALIEPRILRYEEERSPDRYIMDPGEK
jgi:hypothetical protein